MKRTQLEKKLLAAARNHPPGDHVPYAFEKRIMARLAAIPAINPWTLWSRVLWRAVLPCLAVTILCGIWSFGFKSSEPENLAQELEHSVYAAVNPHSEDIW